MNSAEIFEGRFQNKPELTAFIGRTIDDRERQHREDIEGLRVGPPKGKLNFIATGDSWFDYPLNGVAGSNSDIIEVLNGHHGTSHEMYILNYGHAGAALLGDSITQAKDVSGDGDADAIGGAFRLFRLQLAISKPEENGVFDAMLLSAGGNDFAGKQFASFMRDSKAVGGDPDQALNEVFDAKLAAIREGYEGIIRFRDAHLPGRPIFVNGYANAIPDGRSVCKSDSGWLRPGFLERDWKDMGVNSKVVVIMLTRFRDMVASLGRDVFLVDTASVLDSDEWANELHPTSDGFKKVAGAFLEAIKSWSGFSKRLGGDD